MVDAKHSLELLSISRNTIHLHKVLESQPTQMGSPVLYRATQQIRKIRPIAVTAAINSYADNSEMLPLFIFR